MVRAPGLLLVFCLACSGTAAPGPETGSGGATGTGGVSSTGGAGSGGQEATTGGADTGSGGEAMGGASDGGSVGTGGASGGSSSGGSESGGAPSSGGQSSGGADGSGGESATPISEMVLPAKLQDQATCWQEEFGEPLPICIDIPTYDPPVIEWSCGDTVAALVVPAGACLVVKGRFTWGTDLCMIEPTAGCAHEEPPSSTSEFPNTTDEAQVFYIHRRRDCSLDWTAWWYEGSCP